MDVLIRDSASRELSFFSAPVFFIPGKNAKKGYSLPLHHSTSFSALSQTLSQYYALSIYGLKPHEKTNSSVPIKSPELWKVNWVIEKLFEVIQNGFHPRFRLSPVIRNDFPLSCRSMKASLYDRTLQDVWEVSSELEVVRMTTSNIPCGMST